MWEKDRVGRIYLETKKRRWWKLLFSILCIRWESIRLYCRGNKKALKPAYQKQIEALRGMILGACRWPAGYMCYHWKKYVYFYTFIWFIKLQSELKWWKWIGTGDSGDFKNGKHSLLHIQRSSRRRRIWRVLHPQRLEGSSTIQKHPLLCWFLPSTRKVWPFEIRGEWPFYHTNP